MGRFALLTVVAAVLVTACGTAITGEFPFPVRTMEVESFSVPQQITAGETHTLDIGWSGGADSFTVTWMFGGATLQTVMVTSGTGQESSVVISFNLDNDEPGTFSGLVQVVDDRGNQLDQPFSYSVQAQP